MSKRTRAEQYEHYLQSKKWKKKRLRVLKRDGYSCQVCGATGRLHVHHLTYERFGKERLDDLKTLCESCHATVHKKKGPPKRANLSATQDDVRYAEKRKERATKTKGNWREPDVSSPFRFLKEKNL